jgi:hypothetical protein
VRAPRFVVTSLARTSSVSANISNALQEEDFKQSFSAYYFLKVHSHHFSKIKSQKEVTEQ